MPSAPKHLPAAERRAATVHAVVSLAAHSNPSGITTTEIAREMGLTQGALFKHFPTKDAVLQAVLEWVAESLMARLDAAAGAAASPLDALEALFLAHVEFVVAHPGVPRIVFGELQRARQTAAKRIVQAMQKRYAERVAGIIADAKGRGQLDAALDAEAASILFIGMIQGLVMQSLLSGDMSRIRRTAPRVFAVYRSGIEAAR